MTLAYNPPVHTGQATQIEQARAQAEVEAAVLAAKRWPRDEDACEAKMRRACQRTLVAEKAFWRFPRSGEQLTGPTIHLARTLAGVWGNLQYGVVELDRDTVRHQSQILAVAWDLESNVRPTTTFLAPHVRDTKSGAKPIVDLRDIYENNANMGARRVREMIFNVLPDWFTEQAEDICRATLEKSDKPIEAQREAIVKTYAGLGVTGEMLEDKVGKAVGEMLPGDLALLRIIGKSIRRGETTVKAEFAERAAPAATGAPVSAAELTGPSQNVGTVQRRPEPTPPVEAETEAAGPDGAPPEQSGDEAAPDTAQDVPITQKTKTALHALLAEAGLTGRDNVTKSRRFRIMEILSGRFPVASTNDLSEEDGVVVVDILRSKGAGMGDYLVQLIRDDDAERAADAAEENPDD